MNAVNECPDCAYPLVCHVKAGKPYWVCPRCHREVPYTLAVQTPTRLTPPTAQPEGLPPRTPMAAPAAAPPLAPSDPVNAPSDLAIAQSDPEVNRLIEDFLSTISHELRTPLSVMRLSLRVIELALQQAGVFTPDQLATSAAIGKVFQHLKTLNQECDREIKLINDLLLLQEFSTAPPPIHIGKIALQAWLPQLIERYVSQANNKQQQLQADIPADLPLIETDARLLERVVTELLDNACKFTPHAGTICITLAAKLGGIQLTICNSDAPIPKQCCDRIFEPFYRVPSENPWQHGGTGLGLSLAKKLADHLHWTLRGESGADKTCFTLEIPCPTSQTVTQMDWLMSYVAYYVSRGKRIRSAQATVPFTGVVYAHWGYHPDFLQFWQHLQSRSDFRELTLEADMYSFGEFLSGQCKVLECARCGLPKTIAATSVIDPLHCPCNRPAIAADSTQLLDEAATLTEPINVILLGSTPSPPDPLTEWLRCNGVNATIASTPAALATQSLPAIVHLIILDANPSKIQAEHWATLLHQYPQLRDVPMIALSPNYEWLTPWAAHPYDATDYVVTPLSGHNLAAQLQRVAQQQPHRDRTEIFWFPR